MTSAGAEATGDIERPEAIDARTFVIPVPTGIALVPSTLCYVLLDGRGEAHVIDPGVATPDNLELLCGELQSRGVERVASITATHMHHDHLGLGAALRERTGASLVLGRIEASATQPPWRNGAGRARALETWGVPIEERGELEAIADAENVAEGLAPDELLDDGDVLEISGRRIRAVLTPGHTPGHLCFFDDDEGRVFTGDHVLPTINPGLGLGHPYSGNPLAVGLAALDAVEHYADREALPGHGRPFAGLGERARRIAAHHRRRADEVRAALDRRPGASVYDVAATIRWTAGWGQLRGFHRLSALAQIAMHVDHLRGASDGGVETATGTPGDRAEHDAGPDRR